MFLKKYWKVFLRFWPVVAKIGALWTVLFSSSTKIYASSKKIVAEIRQLFFHKNHMITPQKKIHTLIKKNRVPFLISAKSKELFQLKSKILKLTSS